MKVRAVGSWLIIVGLAVGASVLGASYYLGVRPFARGRARLVVSTTTSLYDTGLLDLIEERFEAKHPIDIYFISAGTGIAISYAERRDADMIFVHAPSEELEFLEGGYGVCRKIIAYNFFTIVGPEQDPAGTADLSPTEALAKIADAGRRREAIWVSRGDDSGTHIKEKGLWAAAGFDWVSLRDEDWYLESSGGMGRTLQIADEWGAYTLADMGTYLKYHTDGLIRLAVAVDAGKELLNVYSAIAVDKAYNPEANFEAAITLTKFLVSEEGQQIIDEFEHGVYPRKLFYPAVQLLRENTDPTLAGWIKDFAYFSGEECPEEYQDDHRELYS